MQLKYGTYRPDPKIKDVYRTNDVTRKAFSGLRISPYARIGSLIKAHGTLRRHIRVSSAPDSHTLLAVKRRSSTPTQTVRMSTLDYQPSPDPSPSVNAAAPAINSLAKISSLPLAALGGLGSMLMLGYAAAASLVTLPARSFSTWYHNPAHFSWLPQKYSLKKGLHVDAQRTTKNAVGTTLLIALLVGVGVLAASLLTNSDSSTSLSHPKSASSTAGSSANTNVSSPGGSSRGSRSIGNSGAPAPTASSADSQNNFTPSAQTGGGIPGVTSPLPVTIPAQSVSLPGDKQAVSTSPITLTLN